MKFLCAALAALALAASTGCGKTETPNPLTEPIHQLMRANGEMQRQVEAQQGVIRTMGLALVLLGAGLAVSLGVQWRKGGQK
jgi:hypothetical protein